MKRSELLIQLQHEFSRIEWAALEQDRPLAPVSLFNRKILLEMRDAPAMDGEVSMEWIAGLHETLRTYLEKYMAEQPSGWKYIILASLYLAFIAERPMHPIDLLQIDVIETDDGTVYLCPHKSGTKGTVCDYCVCERKSSA